jgi:hypothetical protein
MAEGVGFEPTVSFPTLDFESSALNRTQPPFQSLDIVHLNLRMRNFRVRRVCKGDAVRSSATDVQIWVRHELRCAREFNLAILGGCCGTNERYIEALAKAAVDHGESAAWGPKNVTILGLLSLNPELHIVCPKDSQRYYLLFTRIHKLFALLFTSIRTLLKSSTLLHRHDTTKTRNSARLA